MLRLILYIFAGIGTPLIGWGLSQCIMHILGWPFLGFISFLKQFPEAISIPIITISLAIGMVMSEVLLSNPTRFRVSFKKSRIPLIWATMAGFFLGIIVGFLVKLLDFAAFGETTYRVLTWWFIGATVGIIESLAWQFHSMEAGDSKVRQKRQFISLAGASFFSIIAAGFFEVIRGFSNNVPQWFQHIETPLGFCILGVFLAFVFTYSNSPSYLAALRAGKGFEYRQEQIKNELETASIDIDYVSNNVAELPKISRKIHKNMQFVTAESKEEIEEGLSLKLPEEGEVIIGGIKKTVKKGTDGQDKIVGSDIYLPYTPPHLANIIVTKRETILKPNKNAYNKIAINGQELTDYTNVILKHNTLLTFYTNKNDNNDTYQPEMYRFVYYNRYLSPES